MIAKLATLAGLCIFLLAPSLGLATTYYIDITGGADTNNGTSKVTAWKHARGMPTCTNTCLSTTPVAGDSFIFKGGETWGNANFKWTWSWSGTSGNRIYIGVDQTWFTGGSWTRPIFDAGGTVMSGNNTFMRENGSYVTIDNFEWTGFISTAGFPFGENTYFNPGASTGVTLEHNYFHGWSNDVANTIFVIIRSSNNAPSITPEFTVRYNVFSGKDTAPIIADPNCTGTCEASAGALSGSMANVIGNVCEYVVTCYAGLQTRDIAYNLAYEMRLSIDGIAHGNAFESLRDDPLGTLFHDNVIYAIREAFPGIWLIPESGTTSYMWNNVMVDTGVANVVNLGDDTPLFTPCCGSVVVYNNTLECGPDTAATAVCFNLTFTGEPGSVDATIKNNHFITSHATPIAGTSRSLTQSNNVTQTRAAALAQGYTFAQTPYKFSPVTTGLDTVGVGLDLSANCAIMYTLCTDTTYGVVYNESNHTVSLYGRTATIRSVPWDTGAYEYGAAMPSQGNRFSPNLNLKRISLDQDSWSELVHP